MTTGMLMNAPADAAARKETAAATVLYVPAPHEHAHVDQRLRQLGLSVTVAADAADAARLLRHRAFTVALVHLTDERVSVSIVRTLKAQHPHLYVLGLMDAARPLAAADALRAGVADLLTWPLDEHDLTAAIVNARDRMSPAAGRDAAPAGLFANSPAMRAVMDCVRASGDGSGGVLIFGEPGTGRELAARAIHARSTRADQPFVVVDCASGSLDELEARLFGLVTDRRAAGPERRATERVGSAGAAWRAHGGTLFLRNVVDAPTRVQTKLARLLRDREASLSEERRIIDLDFRPIAAVDSGVDAAMADEGIRRDLFERLAQTRLDMPPLRRRREDVPLIVAAMLRELGTAHGLTPKTCSRAALVMLSALPWPGNGRELRGLLETLTRSSPRPVIQLDDLFEHVKLDGLAARVEAGGTLRDAKARFERDWISAVLMKHHGRVGEAAKALGIQRTNLYRKVRQLKVARTLLGPRRPAP
jgi:DNA-binding NtrC family response regulator